MSQSHELTRCTLLSEDTWVSASYVLSFLDPTFDTEPIKDKRIYIKDYTELSVDILRSGRSGVFAEFMRNSFMLHVSSAEVSVTLLEEFLKYVNNIQERLKTLTEDDDDWDDYCDYEQEDLERCKKVITNELENIIPNDKYVYYNYNFSY